MNQQPKPSPGQPTPTTWFIGVLLLLLALFYISLIGNEAFQQLRQWPTLHQERDFPSYYLAGRRILQREDFYSGLQENGSIATQMARSYMFTGNPLQYLNVMEKINAVTPEDVARAARDYLQGAVTSWAVTAHPDTIAEVAKNATVFAPHYQQAELP